jgi:hypothetical protein
MPKIEELSQRRIPKIRLPVLPEDCRKSGNRCNTEVVAGFDRAFIFLRDQQAGKLSPPCNHPGMQMQGYRPRRDVTEVRVDGVPLRRNIRCAQIFSGEGHESRDRDFEFAS